MIEREKIETLLKTLWNSKILNPLALACCIGLIIASQIFEIYGGEDPCPLCLFQRYFVVVVGLFFALATTLRYFPRDGWRAFSIAALGTLLLAVVVLPETASILLPRFLINLLEMMPLCLRYLLFLTFLFSALLYLIGATSWLSRKMLLRLSGGLILLAAVMGAGTSIRHVWIQTLPIDQVPACTPPLDFMVEIQGVWGAIEQTFVTGSGDCHDSSWRFLFLTMPMWVLLWFLGLGFFGVLRNTVFPQDD